MINYVVVKYTAGRIDVVPYNMFGMYRKDTRRRETIKETEYLDCTKAEILKRYPNSVFLGEEPVRKIGFGERIKSMFLGSSSKEKITEGRGGKLLSYKKD